MSLTPLTADKRWLFALLAGVAAVAGRASLQPLLADQLPFVLAFPVSIMVALLWGSGPAVLTATVCTVASLSGVVPPNLSGKPLLLGVFLVGTAIFAAGADQASRWRHKAGATTASSADGETPLTSWLRAVLWGAMLLPLLAFAAIAWWGFQRTQREAETTVAHVAELAQQQAQRTFAVAMEVAQRADAVSASMDPADEEKVHQRLADVAIGLPFVIYLTVWDADGNPLARSDVYPLNRKSTVSDRAYFQALRSSDGPMNVSDVLLGRQSGRELTNASVRRASPDGSFRGIVSVSLAPGYFRSYYEELGAQQPTVASFALIRLDGEIIARWPKTSDGRTHVPANSPTLAAIVKGERAGTFDLPASAERESRMISFRRLDGFPLYVAVGVSREAMFASWERFVALLAAVLLPTTVVLVYVSWVALNKTQHEAASAAELQEQIRRRAKAEQSMLQSQKLETLALVTGGVAHDFNNLLAIVNASLHVHKRKYPELAKDKQVEAMARSVQSGVRLTRQLLSFTRKQAMRPELVILQTWLPAVEELVRTTLGSVIAWELRVEPDTAPISVDVGELELAIINLVVNARHAMQRGGVLTLHAENTAESAGFERPMVSISVADSGVGIPADVLPKVMEPFFTTRPKGAGSGLGLSQVQGFCTQSDGEVRIDSIVGKGTTVCMYLPASGAAVARPPVQEGQTGEDIRLEGAVLLVEDNEDVASTTAAMLASAGLAVTLRSSADAALAHLSTLDALPDIVVSDIAMPGSMNGIALAFELRKRYPHLPVLLTTGYAEQLNEAMAGGLSVLQKPSSPSEILSEMSALMAARATQGS